MKMAQVGNSAEKELVKEMIYEKFGEKEAVQALKVAYCESGFQEKIISRTFDIGVFQINLKAHWKQIVGDSRAEKIKNLQNPEYNIWFAHWLWERESWRPWAWSEHCWSKI